MLVTLPFVLGVLIVASEAVREAKAARSQQQTQGIITAYDRSDHNQCSYDFEVSGKRYSGRRSAATIDVTVGSHVPVFYDSQEPSVNSLEDFAEMSRRDRDFCYILLFVIGVFPAIILYSKAVRASQDELTAGSKR